MRLYQTATEKQKVKICANWARISRLGLPLFTLLLGTAILVWTCLCYIGFSYLYGTQRLLHETWYIQSVLPFMAFLSYIFPLAYYGMVWIWIKRIGPTEASTGPVSSL
jgi:hypothetical protein